MGRLSNPHFQIRFFCFSFNRFLEIYMKRTLLSGLAFTLLFAACKKAETPDSFEDKLRGGQWKRSSLLLTFRLGTGEMTTQNAYAPLDTCLKDNTLEFKTAYVGTERKGNYKCSVGDPDETTFNWEIFNSGKNIRIYNVPETFDGESSINADIVTLTTNQLSLRYVIINRNPITQTADTFTFADVFRK